MILHFQKNAQRHHVLQCIRDDQSVTWTVLKSRFQVHHDFWHYVVEKNLDYRDAFYGTINEGYEISDFEAPRDQRPEALLPKNMHRERPNALRCEVLVGLLQTVGFHQEIDKSFMEMYYLALKERSLTDDPNLTIERIQEIKTEMVQLWNIWEQLPTGQTLALTF